MGLLEERGIPGDIQTAITKCLFQVRNLIAQKWQANDPPTGTEWRKVIDNTIRKEEFIYNKRGNRKEFKNIWKQWVEVEAR